MNVFYIYTDDAILISFWKSLKSIIIIIMVVGVTKIMLWTFFSITDVGVNVILQNPDLDIFAD